MSSDAATGNQWYKDGNLITGETNQTYTATTSGNYSVIVTINTSSSAASTDVTVTVNPQVTSDTTASVCNQFTWHSTEYKATGNYVWVGTTAAGCDSTVTLHLTILSVTSTITKTDAVCFGTLTGSISVTPTFGVAPYTYRIGTLGSFVSSNTFNNLKVGKYTVSIIDAEGCRGISAQVNITQPLSVTGSFTATPTSCNGGSDGSLRVSGVRGNAPFNYRYGTTGAFSSSNTFSSIKAGVHKISIQDATGCISVISATVPQPTKVNGTYSVTNASCPGMANGTVTLNGSGGIPPYTYRWGTVGGFSTPNNFTGISEGSYRVFVLDANNCFGYSVLATVANASPACSTRPLATRSSMANDERSREKDVMLTPNPTNNQFVFRSGSVNNQAIQMRVFDANGKVIFTAKPTPDQPFRFGEELTPGIYMIEVRQGNNVKTIKAVKIK